ncbi:hypothetical protein CUR178_01047 [Leishmania enriettii]|uniref:Uncharacterized protein n=1 Tax=Leishmania enriettii TaxID=5663 RepID=A0A836K8Q2_LEIEN|nr:hypothetical protein CUR178_01047 [Leishmania enriettii]
MCSEVLSLWGNVQQASKGVGFTKKRCDGVDSLLLRGSARYSEAVAAWEYHGCISSEIPDCRGNDDCERDNDGVDGRQRR